MALRYILGIDLGISSIGTALFKILPGATDLNDIHSFEKILDAGVRICSVTEGAVNRRILRSQRNAKKHRKARKKALIALLQEYKLLPLDRSELELGLRSQPYALRAKAMQEPFDNPFELGFCIMNIAKLRGAGFIDEAEEDEDEKKKSKTANRYQILEQELKTKNITLSEFLADHLAKNNCIRQRLDFIAEKVPFSVPRYLVKRDYYALMEKQAKHFGLFRIFQKLPMPMLLVHFCRNLAADCQKCTDLRKNYEFISNAIISAITQLNILTFIRD